MLLREKLGVLNSLWIMTCCTRTQIYGEIVSQLLLPLCCVLSLAHPVHRSCSASSGFLFFVFSEEVVPYVAIDSVYLSEWDGMGGKGFRILLHCHLELEPLEVLILMGTSVTSL